MSDSKKFQIQSPNQISNPMPKNGSLISDKKRSLTSDSKNLEIGSLNQSLISDQKIGL